MRVHSIKYVLKYVTKGCDQAVFALEKGENVDEIQRFQEARYVGSSEAAWRTLDCPLHERFPPVVQLAVHLENRLRVYFTEATVQERAEAEPPWTTLTEYFSLNQSDSFARSLLYVDFTHGTRHERFEVTANVETKWHTRRTPLKPLPLNGFTLSVPDKGSATISVCCCMKCVVLCPLMT